MDAGAATGNGSKAAKIKKKKTNAALFVGVGLVALGGLIYVVVRHREAISRAGMAAVRPLGPLVTRVLPAVVLGVLSMVVGPEGAIAGVPIGLIAGPAIINLLAGGQM